MTTLRPQSSGMSSKPRQRCTVTAPCRTRVRDCLIRSSKGAMPSALGSHRHRGVTHRARFRPEPVARFSIMRRLPWATTPAHSSGSLVSRYQGRQLGNPTGQFDQTAVESGGSGRGADEEQALCGAPAPGWVPRHGGPRRPRRPAAGCRERPGPACARAAGSSSSRCNGPQLPPARRRQDDREGRPHRSRQPTSRPLTSGKREIVPRNHVRAPVDIRGHVPGGLGTAPPLP